MDGNTYQKAVELLVREGHTIVQFMVGKEWLYFTAFKFSEAYFNTAASIDYNVIEGVNITDFLRKQGALFGNSTSFMSAFNQEVEHGTILRCQFPKEVPYLKWQAINK